MAGTREGNRKIREKIREKYGVDENGKSNFHKMIGSKGGQHHTGYFSKLAEDNPELLAEIGRRGYNAGLKRRKKTDD